MQTTHVFDSWAIPVPHLFALEYFPNIDCPTVFQAYKVMLNRRF